MHKIMALRVKHSVICVLNKAFLSENSVLRFRNVLVRVYGNYNLDLITQNRFPVSVVLTNFSQLLISRSILCVKLEIGVKLFYFFYFLLFTGIEE